MAPDYTIGPARPEERAEAFRLIFQQLSERACAERTANALELAERGELNPEGILVARTEKTVLGSLICQPVPGASGLLWPPQVRPTDAREEIEDRLLVHATAWLRQRGAKLGQALLTIPETSLAAPLVRHGLAHVTRLWYLRHALNLRYDFLRTPDHLTFHSYRDGDPDLFQRTLLRTYEGSLDCPEVNGVRTMAEILEGHRAQGVYDPTRWWLALDGEQPVGVLILTEMPEWQTWDLAYLGVVPEARRRGWGRELVHKALRAAHASEATQLTLSVDARNRPAWKLYVDLGFEPYDEREVYLAIWNPPPGH